MERAGGSAAEVAPLLWSLMMRSNPTINDLCAEAALGSDFRLILASSAAMNIASTRGRQSFHIAAKEEVGRFRGGAASLPVSDLLQL